MKTRNRLIHALAALAPAALLALAGAPLAAQEAPPANPPPTKCSLAVMPFTFNVETLRTSRDGEVRLAIQQFETSALTNKFITALVQTRKFDVIERSRIDQLVQEMQLSETGLVDPRRAAQAGQMIGADYFLMGEITVFTVNVQWRRVPHTTWLSRTITAQIICDMRIVDTRTSRVVAAERGEVRQEVVTRHQQQVETVFPPDMIDALQRELCSDLTIKTVDGVYPIRIIGMTGGVISLNRGEGGGLEVGQLLDVFAEGEEMIDPDTGESLGFEEVRLGQLRVTEVLQRFSKAVPVGNQSLTFPNGAICRKVRTEPVLDAPGAPPPRPNGGGPRW